MINLLSYTKKLSEKIRLYDTIAQKPPNLHTTNPFASPMNITIVWVEEEQKNAFQQGLRRDL
jgi:hypothetical protein